MRRFGQYLVDQHPGPNPFGLTDDSCRVDFCGIGGGRLSSRCHVRMWEEAVERYEPDSLIVQVGGNDLDSECGVSADGVVFRLVALMSLFLAKYQLTHVFVNQLLPRYQTRHVPVDLYNDSVVSSNRLLKLELGAVVCVSYWKLRGLQRCELFQDGVHLNGLGMAAYYRNVRGAVLRHVASL